MTTSTSLRSPSTNESLAQFTSASGPTLDPRATSRTLLAWLMVCVGIGVSIWLVYRIQGILLHPDRLAIPLLPIRAEDLLMTIPSGKIQLPPAAITVVHYLVLILLLAIVGKIAIALIGHGASLLRESKSDPEHLPLAP